MVTCEICPRCQGARWCDRIYGPEPHYCHECNGEGYIEIVSVTA